jgi:drug/metabolite transporter (DMT)-like permease
MADGFAFLSYNLGVRTEDLSLVAPVASCAPLVAILLARIFFGEEITKLQKVGVASVVVGIAALSVV